VTAFAIVRVGIGAAIAAADRTGVNDNGEINVPENPTLMPGVAGTINVGAPPGIFGAITPTV